MIETFIPRWIPDITPAGVGVWSLLVVILSALIKIWPIVQLQTTNAKEKLRGEHRSDLSDCQRHIEKLQAQISGLAEEIHRIELKLLGAITAYRILDVEVQMLDKDSRALVQARQVMSAAFTMSPSTGEPE